MLFLWTWSINKKVIKKSVHKWSTLSGEEKAQQEYFEEEDNKLDIGHDITKLVQLPKQEYFEEDVVKMEIEEEGIKTE